MQLALHATRQTPHGASRLVQAMFALSVKSRGAPSQGCRDARVCGHATMAMHDMSTPPLGRVSRGMMHTLRLGSARRSSLALLSCTSDQVPPLWTEMQPSVDAHMRVLMWTILPVRVVRS